MVRLYATQGLLAGVRASEARRPNTGCFMTQPTHVCGCTQHKTCLPACAPARHRAQCPCNPLCSFRNMRRQLRIQSRDKVSACVGQLGECLGTAAKGPAYVRAGAFNRGRRPPLTPASRVQNNRFVRSPHRHGCARRSAWCTETLQPRSSGTPCKTSRAQVLAVTGELHNGLTWNRLRASSFRAETRRGGSNRRG